MGKFSIEYSIQRKLIISFSLILFLAWFFIGVPFLSQISRDDLREYSNIGPQKLYDFSTKEFNEGQQIIFVKDRILSKEGRNLIIESNSVGTNRYTGEMYWNATTTYVVDKSSRKNVPGIREGVDRQGYFIFPMNLEKKDYNFSSPEVLEKESVVKFVSEEKFWGINVYKFNYSLEGLDKTMYFSLIPQGYKIIGEHKGTMLVEPRSGVIIDFEHSGVNRLYDENGKYVLDYEVWENSFNDATISSQMNLAGNVRNKALYVMIVTWSVVLLNIVILMYYLIIKKRGIMG